MAYGNPDQKERRPGSCNCPDRHRLQKSCAVGLCSALPKSAAGSGDYYDLVCDIDVPIVLVFLVMNSNVSDLGLHSTE